MLPSLKETLCFGFVVGVTTQPHWVKGHKHSAPKNMADFYK